MRDMQPVRDSLPDDVIYKDVVVIGNGPSGICVSHHLAGNWPSLVTGPVSPPHPDPMLQARVQGLCGERMLGGRELEEAARGLEGRSNNPLPLLLDNLMHPGADMGSDLPSMLEWKYYPERQIEHIVLGRGKPGGLWHSLDSSVVTLSPARWMALPGVQGIPGSSAQSRVAVPNVATYYENFVTHSGIQRFFRNNTIVTSVRPIRTLGRLDMPPSVGNPVAWCVCGYDTAKREAFRYVSTHVILATGASDRPNTLEGRNTRPQGLPGAIRTPQKLTKAIDALEDIKRNGGPSPLPVLVIGSGLSAADAILRLRKGGFSVLHAHRGASVALRGLPKDLYPEYYQVYRMMREGSAGKHELYTSLPDHVLLEIRKDGKVVYESTEDGDIQNYITPRTVHLLNTKTNETVDLDISLCAVLIGSRPDLNFLADDFDNSFVTWDIDNKTLKTDFIGGMKKLQNNGYLKRENVLDLYSNRKSIDVQNNNNSIVLKKEQTFEESLFKEDVKKPQPHPTEMCIKCSYRNFVQPRVQNVNSNKQCFLKMQWNNLKYIVGQGLQRTRQDEKSDSLNDVRVDNELRYNGAIEGSGEQLNNNINKVLVNGKIMDVNDLDQEVKGSGLGLGIRSDKPIDCRNNPIAIVQSSHAVLNAPKGLYALGPLTGDNFVRFIPGGAVAIVSDIWSERKSQENLSDCTL